MYRVATMGVTGVVHPPRIIVVTKKEKGKIEHMPLDEGKLTKQRDELIAKVKELSAQVDVVRSENETLRQTLDKRVTVRPRRVVKGI